MTTESKMREAASKAFVTAFLLSGDANQAEAAVLKSIESMNCGEASGDELIRNTVSAAIELRNSRAVSEETGAGFFNAAT